MSDSSGEIHDDVSYTHTRLAEILGVSERLAREFMETCRHAKPFRGRIRGLTRLRLSRSNNEVERPFVL